MQLKSDPKSHSTTEPLHKYVYVRYHRITTEIRSYLVETTFSHTSWTIRANLCYRIIQYTYDIVAGGRHNVSKLNSWGVANGAGLSVSRSKLHRFNSVIISSLSSKRSIILLEIPRKFDL